MKSSFVRRQGAAAAGAPARPPPRLPPLPPPAAASRRRATFRADLGTRPGPFGQALVSTGHADLDRLLGGGLPVGGLLLVLEDGWTTHAAALARLFLGEGAARGQALLLLAADPPAGGLAEFLPARAVPRGGGSAAGGASSAAGGGADAGGAHCPPPPPGADDAAQLRIAWQYGRYLNLQPSNGASSIAQRPLDRGDGGARAPADWARAFDLSRGAGAAAVAELPTRAECPEGLDGYEAMLAEAARFIEALRLGAGEAAAARHVGRVAALSLGAPAWGGAGAPGAGRAAVQALARLRVAARDARVAVLATAPAALFGASDLARLQHAADAVAALEAVTDASGAARLAPDRTTVAGLLTLRKLPALGAPAAPPARAPPQLVRRRRRRLDLTPVEIDPDAEAAAAAAAGARPAAAGLCGGGPPGQPNALDF